MAIVNSNIERKDWLAMRRKRVLYTSASQQETYDLCRRKWWLGEVRKLYRPPTGSTVFGTVLHSVVERFLGADDLGNDLKTGKPVDLYPEGWHIAASRFGKPSEGEVTPAEQVIIKKLISEAIASGLLRRDKDRVIEHSFQVPVISDEPCPNCKDWEDKSTCDLCGGDGKGTSVYLKGFIDVMTHSKVTDHKTLKSIRWAKSRQDLKRNIQALAYAHVLLEMYRESGQPVPETITLQHAQYCKDEADLRVRDTSVEVTPDEIDAEWNRIIERSKGMVELRNRINNFFEIPEPPDMSKACNAYGGCPFRTICTGRENETGYENRLDRWLESNRLSNIANSGASAPELIQPSIHGKEQVMGIAEILAAKRAANAAAGGAVASAPTNPAVAAAAAQVASQVTAPVTTAAQAATTTAATTNGSSTAAPTGATTTVPGSPPLKPVYAEGQSAPPWANPECRACNGFGFNSIHAPCLICNNKAIRENRPNAKQFTIDVTPEGTAVWQMNGNDTVVGESPLPPFKGTGTVKSEQKTDPLPANPQAAQAAAQAAGQSATPQVTPSGAAPAGTVAAKTEAPAQGGLQMSPDRPITNEPAVPATEPAETEDKKTGTKGPPRKGFILVVNAAVAKGIGRKGTGRYVHHLTDILKTIHDHIAAEKKVSSVAEVEVFHRRDLISAMAADLIEEFGADIVVASGIGLGQSDLRVLFEAIRPHAGMEIIAEAI